MIVNSAELLIPKNLRLVISLLVFLVVTLSFVTLLNVKTAHAAITDLFDPEYIISDKNFSDWDSMSANQIQQFLENKNSTCLKNLKTLGLYDQNGDGLGDEPYGKGANYKVRASTLIQQAAKLYGINPKVILVTLQKEQGLITRTDCPSWRYNTALGYGCPDTAPCDTTAYGFTRQIDYGVWHFMGFFTDTYPIPTKTPGKTYIAYSPNSSCGGTTLNIHNYATSALYSYTPYQPNKAARNAAIGQEVTCGAYGNKNFYYYYYSWFGKPNGNPFTALTTPRWMQRNKDTYKYDLATGSQTGSTLTEGTQADFVEKITINDITYLRTKADKNSGEFRGVPLSDLIEIPYTRLPEPIKMNLTQRHNKVIPNQLRETSSFAREGQSIYFSSKVTVDGKTYYRTKTDTEAGNNYGIRDTYLRSPEYVPLENPRYMQISANINKLNPIDDTTTSTLLTKDAIVKFSSKIYVNEQWYYRAESDSSNSLAVPTNSLKEVTYGNISPIYVKVTVDTHKVKPATGTQGSAVITANSRYRVEQAMTIDGVTYYRILDTQPGANTELALPASAIQILPTVVYQNIPTTVLTVKNTGYRIHPYYQTSVGPKLKAGEKKTFTTKAVIDGVTYYRTRNDTNMNWQRLIPATNLKK